jgi:hypothetical protein
MTFIGKLIVLVNLVISLLVATVALGLYATGIDWTERAGKPGEPPGLTAQRKAELKEVTDMIPLVEAGRIEINKRVVATETRRLRNQVAYAAELAHIQRGASAEDPARTIELQEDGRPKLDPMHPTGLARVAALDRGKQPLQSIAAYEGFLQKAITENEGILKQLDTALNQDIQLTLRLVPMPGERGLREQLAQEREKRLGIQTEIDAVTHLGTKAVVEGAVIQERIDALDAQIAALKAALSRVQGVDSDKEDR